MCVCVHNNTRPIAVATRIALLRCSVIEIRCWTRYSCKISRPPWNTKGVQGGDWIIVIIYLLIVKRSTLYKQDLDFKNGKNARKNHGYFLVGVGSLIPRMEMRWTKIELKREREKKKRKKIVDHWSGFLPLRRTPRQIRWSKVAYEYTKTDSPLRIETGAVFAVSRVNEVCTTIKQLSFVLLR